MIIIIIIIVVITIVKLLRCPLRGLSGAVQYIIITIIIIMFVFQTLKASQYHAKTMNILHLCELFVVIIPFTHYHVTYCELCRY